MKIEIKLVFCALVVLTSSPQTKGQSPAAPNIVTPPALQGEGRDRDEAPTEPDVTDGLPRSESDAVTVADAVTDAVTDAGDGSDSATTPRITTPQPTAAPSQDNSSVPAVAGTSSPSPPFSGSSASPAEPDSTLGGATTTHLAGDHQSRNTTPPPRDEATSQPPAPPSTLALTPAPTQPPTTDRAPTSGTPRAPAGPSPQDVPSELNVGDEDDKLPHSPSSPLDPLLAALVSVFIVTTAIISVVLFLKFRQRTDHPEFHRLQDLPMDDLMEDTPLSRYTY